MRRGSGWNGRWCGGEPDWGRRGLRLAADRREKPFAVSLPESAGEGERELVPKEVFFRSLDLDHENEEVDEEEMEEVLGRRDKGGVEELGLVACCMRQWILNQLDRRPYLDTWGCMSNSTHTYMYCTCQINNNLFKTTWPGYLSYLDPDLDMPTMRHFLSLQALQAVRFFLSTTHLNRGDRVR